MNNIYQQKARKYKLKYLKLKSEYISEGGGGGDTIASQEENTLENILVAKLKMHNRLIELGIFEQQTKKLEEYKTQLLNLEIIHKFQSALALKLIIGANQESQTKLNEAQRILNITSTQLKIVKSTKDSAEQELEKLKTGLLSNENIDDKQRRIEKTVVKVKEEIDIANRILQTGIVIIDKIDKDRQAQISNSEIKQQLNQKILSRKQTGLLKNRST